MNTLARTAAIACLAALACSLPACGGKKQTVTVQSEKTVTMGQELQDLDKAYRDGVINKEEYEKAKKRILDGKK
jgi:hypothetical protein